MTWVAAGATAASVVGGVLGSRSAKKAAKQQQKAAARGQQIASDQYNQIRSDFSPYTGLGSTGANMLQQGLQDGSLTKSFTADDFTKDPGYDFRLNQGTTGVQASAAAKGGLLSGAALKALDEYNQNFASNEYNNAYTRYNNDQTNRYNRLLGVANLGSSATGQVANAGTQYANQAIGLTSAAGNAASAGTIGSANAYSNALTGITNGLNTYSTNNLLSGLVNNSGGSNTGSSYGSTYGNLANTSFNNGANYG